MNHDVMPGRIGPTWGFPRAQTSALLSFAPVVLKGGTLEEPCRVQITSEVADCLTALRSIQLRPLRGKRLASRLVVTSLRVGAVIVRVVTKAGGLCSPVLRSRMQTSFGLSI